jgi:aminoglycoside phosphotransferase (APT) family kinase protein
MTTLAAEHAEADADTTAVREAHRFDEPALIRWMEANVEAYHGPLTVEQFKGGQSNPTYKLVTPSRTYVLRRKPPGTLLKGAHAVEREAKVLSALGSIGFPVARIYGPCTENSAIGSWFYVMEMVEGRIFWDATFPGVNRVERPLYFDALNEPARSRVSEGHSDSANQI